VVVRAGGEPTGRAGGVDIWAAEGKRGVEETGREEDGREEVEGTHSERGAGTSLCRGIARK
jgi:hypothetical protein